MSHPPDSLQVAAGTSVVLTWKVSNADQVELSDPDAAAPQTLDSGTTCATVKPQNDANDYTLVAIHGSLRSDSKTVHVSTHPAGHVFSPHLNLLPPSAPAHVNTFKVMIKGAAVSTADITLNAVAGSTLTFLWEVQGNISALAIDNGVGDVTSRTDSAADDASGSGQVDAQFQPPDGQQQIVYTLTVTPADASASALTETVTVAAMSASGVVMPIFADRLKPDLDATFPLFQKWTQLDTSAQQAAQSAGTTTDGAGDQAVQDRVAAFRQKLAANLAKANKDNPAVVTVEADARRAQNEFQASAQIFQQKSDALSVKANAFLDAKGAYAAAAGKVQLDQGDIFAKQQEQDQPTLGLNFSIWDVVKTLAMVAGQAALAAFTGGGNLLVAAGTAVLASAVDQAKGVAMGVGKQALNMAKDDILGTQSATADASAALAPLQKKLGEDQGKLKDAGDALSRASDQLADALSQYQDALADLSPKHQALQDALAKVAAGGAGGADLDDLLSMYATLQEREVIGAALETSMSARTGTKAANIDALIHDFSDARFDQTAPVAKGFAGGVLDGDRRVYQGCDSLDDVHAIGDQLQKLKDWRAARDSQKQQLAGWKALLETQPAPATTTTAAPAATTTLPPAPQGGGGSGMIATPVFADRLRPDLEATFPLLRKWRGIDAAATASASAAGTTPDGFGDDSVTSAIADFKANLQANIAKAHDLDPSAVTVDADARRARREFRAATDLVQSRYDAFNASANAFLDSKAAYAQAAGNVRLDQGTIDAQQQGQDLDALGIHIDLWEGVKKIGEAVGSALLNLVTSGGNVVSAVTQAAVQSVVDQAKQQGDQIKDKVLDLAKAQITGDQDAAAGVVPDVQKLKDQLGQDQGKLADAGSALATATDQMASALTGYKDALAALEPKRQNYRDALAALAKAGGGGASGVKMGGLLAMYAQLQQREATAQLLESAMDQRVGTKPNNLAPLIHRFLDVTPDPTAPRGPGFVGGVVDSDRFIYQGAGTIDEVRGMGFQLQQMRDWRATRDAQKAQLAGWKPLLDDLAGERPDDPGQPSATTTAGPAPVATTTDAPGHSDSQIATPIFADRLRPDLDATFPLLQRWNGLDAAVQSLATAAGVDPDGAQNQDVADAVSAFRQRLQNKPEDNPAVVTVLGRASTAQTEFKAACDAVKARYEDFNAKANAFLKSKSDYAAAAGQVAQDQGTIDAEKQKQDLDPLGIHFDLWETVKNIAEKVKDAALGALTGGGDVLGAALGATTQATLDEAKNQGTTAAKAVLGAAADDITGAQQKAADTSAAVAQLTAKLGDDQGKLKSAGTALAKASSAMDASLRAYKDALTELQPKRGNYADALQALAQAGGAQSSGAIRMDGVLGMFGRMQEREAVAAQLESAMSARTGTQSANIDLLIHKFADALADASAPKGHGFVGGIVDSDRFVYQGCDSLAEVHKFGAELQQMKDWRAGRQAQKDQLSSWQKLLAGLT